MFKSKVIVLVGALAVSGTVSADLNTGLVAYWSFDDCTARDNSGNENNGIINNAQKCISGISGTDKSLIFNGVNDVVSVQNSPSLNSITNQLSTVTWIKFNDIHTTSYGYDWQSIINKSGFASSYGLMLAFGVTANPKILRFYHNGASLDTTDYAWSEVKENQWYLIATTYDGSTAKIYINGKLVSTNAVTGNIKKNTDNLYIGKSVNNWYPYYLNADISGIRIYNRALTDVEVMTIYKQGILTPNSFRGAQTFKRDAAISHMEAGEYRYYYFPKQVNVNNAVDLAVTAGNCDLYGNSALAKPADMLHRQSVNADGQSEHINFTATKQGYYYVLVKAVTACDFVPPKANGKVSKLIGKHTIRLDKESTIGIISTGTVDLQGMLLDNNGEYVTDLDHANHVSRSYKTFMPYQAGVTPVGMTATNFMITPGVEKDIGSDLTKRRTLPVGDYHLLVSPDNDATGSPALDTAQYGILVLKRPDPNSTVTIQSNDFFTGLQLLATGDSDSTNNYMDIYVRALYPHVVSTNWGNTVAFLNVPRERQCKALNNFYFNYILNNDGYMNTDTNIRAKWNNDEGFSLLGSTGNVRGTIVYNSYSVLQDLSVIHRGDLFAKNRGTYNHYGLYFENARINSVDGSELTRVIDANGSGDGKLQIVDAAKRRATLAVKNSWKVARSSKF